MKATDFKSKLERRVRVADAAQKKVDEARKALLDAQGVFNELVPAGIKVTSKIVLGNFRVDISFGFFPNFPSYTPNGNPAVDVSHTIYFHSSTNEFLDLEDVLAQITPNGLEAFKQIKKNVDDFLDGKIAWPYPHEVIDS